MRELRPHTGSKVSTKKEKRARVAGRNEQIDEEGASGARFSLLLKSISSRYSTQRQIRLHNAHTHAYTDRQAKRELFVPPTDKAKPEKREALGPSSGSAGQATPPYRNTESPLQYRRGSEWKTVRHLRGPRQRRNSQVLRQRIPQVSAQSSYGTGRHQRRCARRCCHGRSTRGRAPETPACLEQARGKPASRSLRGMARRARQGLPSPRTTRRR